MPELRLLGWWRTAAEDRLTFAPAHYRGAAIAGGGQTSEAGSLIRLRGASSLRGRDPRVVGSFGVADLACDLGTQARDCPKKAIDRAMLRN